MIYATARPRIRSGDAILLSHSKWGSWYDLQVMAVRLGQMSEYTHAGVAWVVAGRVFILHAIGAGVSITPLSHELPFYWIPIDRWTAEAEEWALARVGEPYSKWQAIQAFFGRLKAGADGAWQCAEFAAMALNLAGTPVGYDALTPTKLARRLQALDYPIYLVENEQENGGH